MKRRLLGITQRRPIFAAFERDPQLSVYRRTDRSDGIELLINYVRGHVVALKQITIEPPEITIDVFDFLNFLDPVDRCPLAFIEKLGILYSLDLLHLAHQVITQRSKMR